MKKIFASVIAALTIVGTSFGAREMVNGVEYNYSIKNGQATIESRGGLTPTIPQSTSGGLVIPSTLGGCPVTTIGDWAFFGCESLKSITIPNSVTKIGGWAFIGCKSLTSITMPKSVMTIGEGAFGGCMKLQAINVVEENPGYRSVVGVLYSKEGGTLLAVPGALTSITIPNSVTKIGGWAFRGCKSLTSITIPEGVTEIGEYAFSGCSSLTSITMPNSVTTIGEGAFGGCWSLKSITIPNGVTEIGNWAFDGCESLRDVYVEKGCTERVRKLLAGAGARGDLVFHEQFSIVDILAVVVVVALLGGAVLIILIRRKKCRKAAERGSAQTQETIREASSEVSETNEAPVSRKKYCTGCGTKLVQSFKFCPECGAKL